jgi:hypothetical protein
MPELARWRVPRYLMAAFLGDSILTLTWYDSKDDDVLPVKGRSRTVCHEKFQKYRRNLPLV